MTEAISFTIFSVEPLGLKYIRCNLFIFTALSPVDCLYHFAYEFIVSRVIVFRVELLHFRYKMVEIELLPVKFPANESQVSLVKYHRS